jgi:hypothetical protein
MPRPQRIRKQRFKTEDVKEAENDHPMDEPVEEYKPRAKRPRKTKAETNDGNDDAKAPPKKKARKAGSLAKLQEMPLDITFEVRSQSFRYRQRAENSGRYSPHHTHWTCSEQAGPANRFTSSS